jgi:hypothetical protein
MSDSRVVRSGAPTRFTGRVLLAMVTSLVLIAAACGGEAERDILAGSQPTPLDQPLRPFVDTWTSRELHWVGSSQTMTIRPAEDGALDIALHDYSSWRCSDPQTRRDRSATPSTMTGTGRLEDATTLVVPSPVLACVGVYGREKPGLNRFSWEEGGTSYTLVLDLATGRLFDNVGVAWHRGAPPENGADTTTEVGADRSGTFAMLFGEVTFHAARPWNQNWSEPGLFFLVGRVDYWGADSLPVPIIEIRANPLPPVASERACRESSTPPASPASAEELVQAIRSNPDLETTVPVTELVGGIDALRLDVAAVPGASTCPGEDSVSVLSHVAPGGGGVSHGTLGRLYVLDLPGGSARALAILITAPEAAFERAVEAAAPVVDSFEFHTG